ncbi:MAG: pro-sigmaK processing inhibitor BofA family protein [Ruminococcus sp.]|nr:pro-sigmaK processing inhibitor BofA family protein [Ruminococcus sp.]
MLYPFIFLAVLIIFAIIHKLSKNKRPLLRAFLSMLMGFVSLLAVNLSGYFTGVFIPFSVLSILVSVIGGVPGVCSLLALNLFF